MTTVIETAETEEETAVASSIDLELEVGDHENAILDARFRCDHSGCGAQAYVRATLKDERQLYFCGHHAKRVRSVLHPLCSEWYSETNRLIEDKKTGSEN